MIGQRIGPYEVVAKLGEGGMGIVYRARDARLDRDVAIKVLPVSVSNDADRLARFEREAKTLAALNHPHIAQIYGLESQALVMELVEGLNLSEVIDTAVDLGASGAPAKTRPHGGPGKGGGLPIADALPIARQIADALEAAHDKGIIHRDLKPANVKLTPDGVVKVLDFGLAKALAPAGTDASAQAMNSPTLTARATQMGLILGTAAYMSPEQARGKTVDKRADIWAFGAVLFEMLSGHRAFEGDDMTATLARVIERDPDWSQLPASTAPALRHLLERCLTKDPKSRLRDIGEARHTLDALIAGRSGLSIAMPTDTPAGPSVSPVSTRPAVRAPRTWIPWSVAAVLAIAAAAAWLRPGAGGVTAAAARRPVRVEMLLPENVEFYSSARISPDGRRVMFVGNRDGVRQVFLRDLDQAQTRVLAGTDGSISVAFSPDSQAAALISTDARLRRLHLDNGAIEDLASGVDIVGGLHWTQDGRILFGKVTKLLSIPATGGPTKDVVGIAAGSNENSVVGPVATPDGRTVLFTAWSGPAGAQRPRIEAVPIDGGDRRVVMEDAGYVLAAMRDRLIYQREAGIYTAPFDPVRAVVTGVGEKLSDEARISPTGGVAADVSPAGDLLFADTKAFNGRLAWVSLDGTERPIQVTARAYNNPRVAPDGRTVAYSDAQSIWTTDIERGAQTKIFTGADALTGFPVWSKDGTELFFRTTSGTMRVRADGGGRPESVAGTLRQDYPGSVSPDGTMLALTRILAETSGDIVLISTKGGAAKTVLATPAYEGGAQYSPDGRWLTYISNTSGRMEVYLRPLEGDERHQVSTSGGLGALWSRDGKRIFFRNGQQFLAVDVTTTPRVSLSAPKVLFERRYSFGPNLTIANYSLSQDGKSFLLVSPGSGHLNLIFNWLQGPSR